MEFNNYAISDFCLIKNLLVFQNLFFSFFFFNVDDRDELLKKYGGGDGKRILLPRNRSFSAPPTKQSVTKNNLLQEKEIANKQNVKTYFLNLYTINEKCCYSEHHFEIITHI